MTLGQGNLSQRWCPLGIWEGRDTGQDERVRDGGGKERKRNRDEEIETETEMRSTV